MSSSPENIPEIGERLRLLGRDCARIINQYPHLWRDTVDWLLQLPICFAFAETRDADAPELHDGRDWIINPNAPGPYYAYDNEEEANRISGPICRRLFNAWDAAVFRFTIRESDRYIDFGIEDAKRIALLAALILNKDFNGQPLGFNWHWVQPEECDSTFEGRAWAWATITSNLGAEESLLDLIGHALEEIEYMDSTISTSKKSDSIAADTVSQRGASCDMHNEADPLPPKPPEILQKLKWVMIYGRKYWKYILVAAIIVLSPFLYSIYVNNDPESGQNIEQSGTLILMTLGEYEVFYPRPYDSTPNLTFPKGTDNPSQFLVMEQRPDGFKVKIQFAVTKGTKITWRANGRIVE